METITKQHAKKLLHFLPIFSKSNQLFVTVNPITGYPKYAQVVHDFFNLTNQSCWTNYEYNLQQAQEFIKDDKTIEKANIDTIKDLLTYCSRSERFSDGHWGYLLEKGMIQKILLRLEQLLPTLPEN